MIDKENLEIREYTGPGYKPVIDFGAWRVAILNYLDEIHPAKIESVERLSKALARLERRGVDLVLLDLVQTGRQPGGKTVFPCVGAVVALTKGYDAGYKGLIPPYVVLTEPQGRFDEAGFLGARYKPFATGGNPAQTPFAVDGIITPGITGKAGKWSAKYSSAIVRFLMATIRLPGSMRSILSTK